LAIAELSFSYFKRV